MQLILCEDNIADAKQIVNYLYAEGQSLNVEVCVEVCTRSDDLLEKLKNGRRYDAYILDIYLQEMNGVELAKKIRLMDVLAQIAFVTASREFAVEAFSLRAVHYLVKPLTEAEVRELLVRILSRSDKETPMFTFYSGKNPIQFKQEEITKIESYRHGVLIYKRGREEPYWFRMLFIDVEEQASEKYFAKASRGVIVNFADIDKVEKNSCYLKDGAYVSISRNHIQNFKKGYMSYLFSEIDGDVDDNV